MEHFFRALDSDREDDLTCGECQDMLPEYIIAAGQDQAGTSRWLPVTHHLETCPHCSAEYVAIMDLIELADGEHGAEPPRYPAPDLSFLRPETGILRRSWRLDDLGRLIVAFSTELLRALQPPTPQPAHALAGLKSDKSSRTLFQLELKEAVEDLEVTITAEEQRDDPGLCIVIVEVEVPSRSGWPHLGDMEVIVKRNGSVLESQRTDAFGRAVFEGIATDDLVQLVFEIVPHP